MRLKPAKEIDYAELDKSRSYALFRRAVKSEKTLYAYKHSLREFLKYTNLSSYDEITKLSTDRVQEILENWIMDLSAKDIKGSSIRIKLAPVELFLDMNRVIFYKKILHKLIPQDEGKLGGNEPFTNDEIKSMLEATKKLRTKAFVHFLASTGIRPGAIIDPILRMKHLVTDKYFDDSGKLHQVHLDGCCAVRVYDNSKEGYWAFLTPECKNALNAYFNSRKLNGEVFTDESPIFANERTSQNDHFGYNSFKTLTTKLMQQAGVARIKNGKRYNKAANYGFRKRFNTILKINNEVNSNIAEKLMAHKNGLDGNYLKPTLEECFNEFVKAIPALTVDDNERLKIQNVLKEQKIKTLQDQKDKTLEKLKETNQKFAHRLRTNERDMDRMRRQLDEMAKKNDRKKGN